MPVRTVQVPDLRQRLPLVVQGEEHQGLRAQGPQLPLHVHAHPVLNLLSSRVGWPQ